MCCLLMQVSILGACVLTQENTHIFEGKETKILHPITYMSGVIQM